MLAGSAATGIAASVLLAPLFDRAIIPGRMTLLLGILAAQLGCLLAKAGLAAAAAQLYAYHGAEVASQLTLGMYQHLRRQSLRYYQDRGVSEVFQLLRGDVAILEGGFSNLAGQA